MKATIITPPLDDSDVSYMKNTSNNDKQETYKPSKFSKFLRTCLYVFVITIIGLSSLFIYDVRQIRNFKQAAITLGANQHTVDIFVYSPAFREISITPPPVELFSDQDENAVSKHIKKEFRTRAYTSVLMLTGYVSEKSGIISGYIEKVDPSEFQKAYNVLSTILTYSTDMINNEYLLELSDEETAGLHKTLIKLLKEYDFCKNL